MIWPDTPSPALIRSARLEAGLTLQAAADILELSGHPRWAEYEAGRRKMPAVAWRYWLHMTGLQRLPWRPRHPPID